MSIFDRVMFESYDFMLEGDQAEEYKARKQKEKEESKREEDRNANRVERKITKQNKENRPYMRDVSLKAMKGVKNTKGDPINNYSRAYDAVDRHNRRHPKQEHANMLLSNYEPKYNY